MHDTTLVMNEHTYIHTHDITLDIHEHTYIHHEIIYTCQSSYIPCALLAYT